MHPLLLLLLHRIRENQEIPRDFSGSTKRAMSSRWLVVNSVEEYFLMTYS